MANWKQVFSPSVPLRGDLQIKTLGEAREWALKTDNGRNEFQFLAGKLIAAAEGGSLAEARYAVVNAAFLIFALDCKREK